MDVIQTPLGTGSGPALYGCPRCGTVLYIRVEVDSIEEG